MVRTTFPEASLRKTTDAEEGFPEQTTSVDDGPTVMSPGHLKEKVDNEIVHDVGPNEKESTHEVNAGVEQGIAVVQPHLSKCTDSECETAEKGGCIVDAQTLKKITAAEKNITHEAANVVAGGPTAMAQKHVGEKIDGKVLHDITEGEKRITNETRPIADGPTAIVQRELSKSGE